ncbi:MAG: polymer-forming cytoskeletal protein [Verrucomicrobiota bacterium]
MRCPECEFEYHVSRAATSSLCPSCSAYTSLEDIHIQNDSHKRIKTQGDVFIHKHATLRAGFVSCRHLHVHGRVSGKIDCSGTATFNAPSKLHAPFSCRQLVVAQNTQVSFHHPVRAQSLQINGEAIGDFFCAGKVTIGPSGAINGELLAKALSISPGGKLNGNFQISRGEAHALEAAREAQERLLIYRRFDPFKDKRFAKA